MALEKSLESIQDPKAALPEAWYPDGALATDEIKRLMFDFEAARCLKGIPRRLGIVSGAKMLSADKKLAAKMANVARIGLQWRGALEPWMDDLRSADIRCRQNAEAYGEGARRQWTPWYYDRITWLEQHRMIVAHWAIVVGRRKEGNQLCSRLLGEKLLMEEVWQKAAPYEWREAEDQLDEQDEA
jgi:hypothetical protein